MKSRVRLSNALLPLLLVGISCGSSKEAERERSHETSSSFTNLDTELARLYALMFDRTDSLPDDFPQRFEQKLQAILLGPETFTCPFDSLIDAGMNIVTSDDGRVRIFYWPHPWTGSYWRFPALVQARTRSGLVFVHNMRPVRTDDEEFDYWDYENTPSVGYQELYRLTDSGYLAIGGGQFMGSMPWINASGLQLRNDSVITGMPLFRIQGESPEAEINLPLTWYWAHPGDGEILYPSFEYDAEKRELTFPEMIASAADSMWSQEPTGRTVRLRFNGRYFMPVTGK